MSNIDLFSLFKSVTGALQNNRESLKKADEYNANHGDNMVEIFDVITQAIKKKGGADPADQLSYASPLSQTPHRAQSGTLVANTLLEMLGSLASKK